MYIYLLQDWMHGEAMHGLLQQWLISVVQNEREKLASFTKEALHHGITGLVLWDTAQQF